MVHTIKEPLTDEDLRSFEEGTCQKTIKDQRNFDTSEAIEYGILESSFSLDQREENFLPDTFSPRFIECREILHSSRERERFNIVMGWLF